MKSNISALVIVHNEEKILSECLEKLQFSNEIVVVLDKCSDNSKKVAYQYTNSIFEGSWEYEGDRRNFGIKKCKSSWIIEIDADEHISKNLADEINDWYRVNDYRVYKKKIDRANVSFWAKNIYKISFYNSIVLFEKKENQIPIDQIR